MPSSLWIISDEDCQQRASLRWWSWLEVTVEVEILQLWSSLEVTEWVELAQINDARGDHNGDRCRWIGSCLSGSLYPGGDLCERSRRRRPIAGVPEDYRRSPSG
ncbi:hypothetical protein L6452_37771 [Arctium lappa]|uniref:Uncharacterized protein n=1 Tax=Arctium lappa TaxID=4217 RepID=A0ACB8Y4L1_ARCLA|nr:hypothetical protein L6452_37771 [Arctium lappa]